MQLHNHRCNVLGLEVHLHKEEEGMGNVYFILIFCVCYKNFFSSIPFLSLITMEHSHEVVIKDKSAFNVPRIFMLVSSHFRVIELLDSFVTVRYLHFNFWGFKHTQKLYIFVRYALNICKQLKLLLNADKNP